MNYIIYKYHNSNLYLEIDNYLLGFIPETHRGNKKKSFLIQFYKYKKKYYVMGRTYYSHDGMVKVEEGKVDITSALRLSKKSSENDAIELKKKIYDKI